MSPPASHPHKARIRAAFDRAAATYDAAASVQRSVAAALADAIQARNPHPRTILDAGCGTGHGAGLLHSAFPESGLVVADFAPAMAQRARRSASLACVADIEALPFADAAFDLWWSSLSVQWCDNARTFAEAARVLRPGSWLAVSTLGPETFHELRTAFAGIDTHRHTLDFTTPEALHTALSDAGFTDISITRQTIPLMAPDLRTLLAAIKAIGANALGSGRRDGMMGRATWRQIGTAYEAFRTPNGLPASHDVLIATARC